MGTLAAIAAIVSIVTTLGGTAVTLNSVLFNKWLNSQNGNVRSVVRNLIDKYNKYFASNRSAMNAAIGKLNNKGTAAFQTWVSHNPVLMASAKDFLKGYDELSDLQNEQTRIENVIASIQSNLNSLGYSTSVESVNADSKKKAEYEQQLSDARKDYDNLSSKVNQVNFTTVNPHTVDTSKLDAVSQNIRGGIKQ